MYETTCTGTHQNSCVGLQSFSFSSSTQTYSSSILSNHISIAVVMCKHTLMFKNSLVILAHLSSLSSTGLKKKYIAA